MIFKYFSRCTLNESMTHLEQLPVDAYDPLDPEKKVLETLFPSDPLSTSNPTSTSTSLPLSYSSSSPTNKSSSSSSHQHHPTLKSMEEILTIVLLFLLFSLPIVDDTIRRFGIHTPLSIYLIKIFFIIIFFGILKTCLKING